MAKAPGFILLSRDLLDKSIFGEPDMLKLWIFILLRTNFGKKSYEYSGVKVGRGQFLRSYRAIARDCAYSLRGRKVQWSVGKVERMMNTLVKDGRIRIIPHGEPNVGTLIEVINYDKWQSIASYTNSEQKSTSKAKQPKANGVDHSIELWNVWLEELSPKGPHPTLTDKRARLLNALYSEHLKNGDSDPSQLFRGMVKCLKASEFHNSKRQYQLPESFLRSPERRESWYLKSLENHPHNPQQAQGVSLKELWSDDK